MKYNLKQSYGKLAYTELERLKKEYKISDTNRNNVAETSTYKIYSSDIVINKNMVVYGNCISSVVKMYINNVNNSIITIKNNSIIVYNGKLISGLVVNFPLFETNNIEVLIDNSNGELIDVDLVFENCDLKTKVLAEKFNEKYYVAKSGVGETIIMEYNSLADLQANLINAIYTVSLTLFDFKIIKDNNCFVGETLVVLGANVNNEVCYSCFEDLFSSNILVSNIKGDFAQLLNINNVMYIYIVSNNKLYVLQMIDNEANIYNINVDRLKYIKAIYTPNISTGLTVSNLYIFVIGEKNKCYLLLHNFENNAMVHSVFLGCCDMVSASIISENFYAYLGLNNFINLKAISLVDKKVAFVKSFGPAKYVYKNSDSEIVLFNNFITVKNE